jgi:phytanoyl-CoA hydroxylase
MAISEEELERFHRDGYVIIRNFLTPSQVKNLAAAAARVLDLTLNCVVATGISSDRLQAGWRGDELIARIVQPVNDVAPEFAALSSHPELLESFGRIFGDKPRFAHEKVVYKQSVAGADRLPVHLFEAFPDGYDDGFRLHSDHVWYAQDHAYPSTAVNCAVFLDDAEGRGPISVLPGTHAIDPEEFTYIMVGDVAPESVRHEELVELPTRAGDLLFFHTRILHVSGPNLSRDPRRVFMATFCPSSDFASDTDRRNGPRRARARALEAQYTDLLDRGEYAPQDFLTLKDGLSDRRSDSILG